MNAAAARDAVRDRAVDLPPEQFEVLCKVVLDDRLRTSSLTVTLASQDGGIDVEGRLDYDWFAADFGVQVKRYARENHVTSDRVHRLAGALVDNGYDVGTLVTTSDFTTPAVSTAERLPIQLVRGNELAATMVDNGIGVRRRDDEFVLASDFWDDLTEATERIPAGEVPLGSNFERMRAVLEALRFTDGTKEAIQSWVSSVEGIDLSDRHVYINANSAAVLELARTEPAPTAGDQKRWGLTKRGRDHLSEPPESVAVRSLLADAIRDVELVDRIRSDLVAQGELTADEIDGMVAAETTGLSESSVRRRASSVRTWLSLLPELSEDVSQSPKVYYYTS
jgi:restriction system protein